MRIIDNDEYNSIIEGLSDYEIKKIIADNFENMADLEILSIQDFIIFRKVSGSFLLAIKKTIREAERQMLIKFEKLL